MHRIGLSMCAQKNLGFAATITVDTIGSRWDEVRCNCQMQLARVHFCSYAAYLYVQRLLLWTPFQKLLPSFVRTMTYPTSYAIFCESDPSLVWIDQISAKLYQSKTVPSTGVIEPNLNTKKNVLRLWKIWFLFISILQSFSLLVKGGQGGMSFSV